MKKFLFTGIALRAGAGALAAAAVLAAAGTANATSNFRTLNDQADPTFNQLWHATQGIDMRFAGHTHFVTVGLALGQSECPVPTCGLAWVPTLQPVVLLLGGEAVRHGRRYAHRHI